MKKKNKDGGDVDVDKNKDVDIDKDVDVDKDVDKNIDKDVDVNKDETLEEVKSRLAKVEADKENYKEGLLAAKAKLKKVKGSIVDDDDDVDDDLAKTTEIATKVATKALEKAADKKARTDFRENNPNITDEEWEKIVLNYTPQHGRSDAESIMKDLDRANLLRQYDDGNLEDFAAAKKAAAVETVQNLAASPNPGNKGKVTKETKEVSESAIAIGKKMRVSKEDLEKEDDSRFAEIEF